MVESRFDSEDFPEDERFDRWRAWLAGTYAPMSLPTDRPDFVIRQRHLALGPVLVWPSAVPGMDIRRTAAQIRASDPGFYHVGMVHSGSCAIDWGDRQTVHRPGQLQIFDSSRPFGSRFSADGGVYAGIGIKVPSGLVGLPRDLVAKALTAPISYREGAGALLTGFVTHLTANADALDPGDAPRLGSVLADLVAAMFAHVVEEESALTPETRRRSLLLRAQAFLLKNLHDPGLGPEAAAAALHISVSHLHQLFRATGTTAGAWIRAQRLDRARCDLTDPALAHLPVRAIGHRWGFTHPATFSRAFRAAYDTSPADHRHQSGLPAAAGLAARPTSPAGRTSTPSHPRAGT
ncbi:helix-turn-helix domain-containing protein [Nocardiopsis sediminis]|uniref:Helix-turn-helix domain-containing protein n=1 Tax=Nocardiopsis sediminis TaxID=1778267 RepID=A0ABV8FQ93_9ACTN